MLGVVGQLAVQEARRIVAGDVDHAELGQRHVGAVLNDGVEFISGGARQNRKSGRRGNLCRGSRARVSNGGRN